MTRLRLVRMMRMAPVLVLLAAVGGCAFGGGESRSTAAARVACRQRADNVFEQQNRDAQYRSDSYSTSLRDSPFGSSGLPGVTTTGLSQQFGLETTTQNCLNGTDGPAATEGGPSAPPVAAAATNGGRAPATVK